MGALCRATRVPLLAVLSQSTRVCADGLSQDPDEGGWHGRRHITLLVQNVPRHTSHLQPLTPPKVREDGIRSECNLQDILSHHKLKLYCIKLKS